MKRSTADVARHRCRKILSRFRRTYPVAKCSLTYRNPLQLLLSTILSAQCTDNRVNQVTPALFAKYRTAADFARARQGDLESLIRSTGFYKSKARSIQAACADIVALHNGRVPDSMEKLVTLRGVGRKTASVVLGNAFGKAEGIAVDTHVMRLTQRMGITRQKTPEKIEHDLMAIVPRADWIEFTHYFIAHGRARCMARNPDCQHCEVAALCPKIGVQK